MNLPKNATLRDLLSTLDHPDAFISKAFGVINHATKEHGVVVMRLGITGTGKAPNYRIESANGEPIRAFNGANHEPWPDGESFTGRDTWSDETMSKADVEALLGEIRNFKRRGSV